MLKTCLLIGAFALTTAAQAQTSPPTTPNASMPESQPAVPPVADVKTGTIVRGADDAIIGRVVQVGETSTGMKAVVVEVDGKRVGLGLSNLTSSGAELKSPLTKAEVLAMAAKPAPATP
jgi:hypothetical protein